MAHRPGARGVKDKAVDGFHPRTGLGRLRRAHDKGGARLGGWERLVDDEKGLEEAERRDRRHTGENLLARFNRVARDGAVGSGEAGEPAVVCGTDGTQLIVRTAEGTERIAQVRRVVKKMLSGVKTPLVVGDRVRLRREDGDVVVVALEPRTSQLARIDSHNRALEHVVAANVDRVLIVSALAEPEFKPGLVDRALVLAHFNRIEATLVLTKPDLADPARWRDLYAGLGYDVHVLVADPDLPGHDPAAANRLRAALAGRTCVVAGQSGVGKSSILNLLHPGIGARVGVVSEALQKGRHTTVAARSYPTEGGGCLIDTPGIRECTIGGLTPLDVALLCPDLAAHQRACRFADCRHLQEPGCAVLAAVDAGTIAASRYASYLGIITEDLAAGG